MAPPQGAAATHKAVTQKIKSSIARPGSTTSSQTNGASIRQAELTSPRKPASRRQSAEQLTSPTAQAAEGSMSEWQAKYLALSKSM